LFTTSQIRKLENGKTLRGTNGFCARVYASGSVSFLVMKKIKGDPVPKSYQVGQAYKDDPNLNRAILNAQAKATQYASLMNEGIDPRKQEKLEAEEKERKEKTLNELLEAYEHSRIAFEIGNAHKTMSDRRNTIENIYGAWMDRAVSSITSEDMLDKYYEYSSGQNPKIPQAVKGIRYIRSVFNFGINTLKVLEVNPCNVFKGMISTKSNKDQTQFLKPSETVKLLRFINALLQTYGKDTKGILGEYKLDDQAITPYQLQSYNAIKLLLYSGLRLNEVLKLKWEDVHLGGTELNEGSYFEILIDNRKQATPFGVPITKEMEQVFSRQSMIQSVVKGTEVFKERKKPTYVFPSPKTDLHMTKLTEAFKYLNQLMPKLISASKIGANQLRHTFATLAYSAGYGMADIDIMTGHGIKNSRNLATEVYVGQVADDNRSRFERVAKAINGTIIKDNEVREITDNIGKDIANDPKVLEEYMNKGMLLEKERHKYNTTALSLRQAIKVTEERLQKLKENKPHHKKMIRSRELHIEDLKESLKRLEEGYEV
jgi:integrase|tara:strand:+ start:592 stop:2220 length:1629 start_codon:yes stop_codon:yes gene_type:complete